MTRLTSIRRDTIQLDREKPTIEAFVGDVLQSNSFENDFATRDGFIRVSFVNPSSAIGTEPIPDVGDAIGRARDVPRRRANLRSGHRKQREEGQEVPHDRRRESEKLSIGFEVRRTALRYGLASETAAGKGEGGLSRTGLGVNECVIDERSR